MATKKDIMKSLTDAGIEYDPNDTKAELEKLLSNVPQPEAPEEPEAKAKEIVEPPIIPDVNEPKTDNQGSREVECPVGMVSRKVTIKEVNEIQADGRLFGWDANTGVASFREE